MSADEPIYAIGDIHGHLDALERAHEKIAKDKARFGYDVAPIVHIGDFVDRGPNACAVMDFLIRGQARNQNWIMVKGNHERMFEGFLDDPPWRDPCLHPDFEWHHPRLGGGETLRSYGVEAAWERPFGIVHAEARARVPEAHRAFLSGLLLSYQWGGVFFVHAGIRPGVAFECQDEDDLLWIRKEFHRDGRDHGALIVHGHTPIDRVRHYGNRINIDTGGAYGNPHGVIVIERGQVFELTLSGRVCVKPI